VAQLEHRIVIVGGGTAGITVAARLRRAGVEDVAVIEPSSEHWYQPLWTLVGGGIVDIGVTRRPEADVMPQGVAWIRDAVAAIDPDDHTVTTAGGITIGYEQLVVAPGIECDWGRIPGVADAVGRNGVSSNYRPDLAPRTWDFVKGLRRGTAVFTMPAGAIKCAGAPQKIAYLASHWWQLQGVLGDIDVKLVLPTPGLFGLPQFAAVLEQVVERYGIDVMFDSELVEVRPAERTAVVADRSSGTVVEIGYDLLHVVPPQWAPVFLRSGPLAAAGDPGGYVEVDRGTLQHRRHPDVFALGDAAGTPNAKTGAAVRKQAPVLVQNLLSVSAGRQPERSYDGYGSCPLVTARNRMVLAEFDYELQHTPSIPVIDLVKERYDMWLLKRYGLPFLYWHGMLRGRA
jgi:sulfide:quinone oxidoreductase